MSPLVLKPAPVTVACEMVRLALPELVKVTLCEAVVPTRTLPMAMLVGVTVRPAWTPPPESVIVAGELVALLTTEILPVTLPAAVGANVTLRVAVWLAAKVSGRVKPLVLNPAPETLICETVTLELPVSLSVTVCVLLVPTNTLPKLKLVGLVESRKVGTKPVPPRAIVSGELVALLTTETLPVTLPAAVGANVTFRVAV